MAAARSRSKALGKMDLSRCERIERIVSTLRYGLDHTEASRICKADLL